VRAPGGEGGVFQTSRRHAHATAIHSLVGAEVVWQDDVGARGALYQRLRARHIHGSYRVTKAACTRVQMRGREQSGRSGDSDKERSRLTRGVDDAACTNGERGAGLHIPNRHARCLAGRSIVIH